MITSIFINFILLIFGAIFYLFPKVTLSDIPLIGEYVSSSLIYMVSIWNSFLDTIPYLQLPYHLLLYYILPFEILLIILKFILGSRVPINNNHN